MDDASGIVGGVLGFAGGLLGNKASADEAARNRRFQRRMYKHRYQYTVEDMRKAGLNPALAYQQGGGSAPSGSMASQDDPISPGIEGYQRATASALAVRANKAQIAQIEAQTKLTNAQARQVELESGARAEWWRNRPAELESLIGTRQAEMRSRQLANDFLEVTFPQRVSIVGIDRDTAEQALAQLKQEIELRGLERAPLEVQSRFAQSTMGQWAPYISSAGDVAGIVSGLINPFLRFLGNRQGPRNSPNLGNMRVGPKGQVPYRSRTW